VGTSDAPPIKGKGKCKGKGLLSKETRKLVMNLKGLQEGKHSCPNSSKKPWPLDWVVEDLGGTLATRYGELHGYKDKAPSALLGGPANAATGALTQFLTAPKGVVPAGNKWGCTATNCGYGPGDAGHFVGYQLHLVPGRIASARFLYMTTKQLPAGEHSSAGNVLRDITMQHG
jgi:hypothetical protein